MIINGTEFNKIQINETVDKTPDGKILRSSLMINIREDDVSQAVKMYRELQKQLEGKEGSQKKQERKTKKVKEDEKSAEAKSEIQNCPKCNSEMILRTNRKTGEKFWSCSQWPLCNGVRKFVTKKELNMPADQDILLVDAK